MAAAAAEAGAGVAPSLGEPQPAEGQQVAGNAAATGSSAAAATEEEEDDEDDSKETCGFCRFMKGGGCRVAFTVRSCWAAAAYWL